LTALFKTDVGRCTLAASELLNIQQNVKNAGTHSLGRKGCYKPHNPVALNIHKVCQNVWNGPNRISL